VTDEPTEQQIEDYFTLARNYARAASKDDQVVEGAAGQAVMQLRRYWGAVKPNEGPRRAWLKVVAVNAARKSGKDAFKNIPFGRGGSELPESDDPEADERAGRLIAEMHLGGGSLASDVAAKVDFDNRWGLLASDHRDLLHAKYAEGRRSKEIAKLRGRGETDVQIDRKLADARSAARLVLEDLL